MKQLFYFLVSLVLVITFSFSQASAQNCQLRTQTMGGWGSKPTGNNPGKYLHTKFASAFPNGLTVGCSTGKTLKFTSAQAITNFLPASGAPAVLSGSAVNPVGLKNTFAGQVTALSLSVGFDYHDAGFGASAANLGNAIINSGPFAGKTVKQVLDEGNKVLGGCASQYSLSALNTIISALNESFVDGKPSNAGLIRCVSGCPAINVSFAKTNAKCFGSCDGQAQVVVSGGTAPYAYNWSINRSGSTAANLCAGTYSITVTDIIGCSATASVTIGQPSAITLTAGSADVSECPNAPTICSLFDIMTLPHGQNVKTYFQSIGVTIAAVPGGAQSKDPVIYNTSGNWTEDPDLNVRLGNMIIINENPMNGDGDGMGPDDSQNGGCLVFTFATPVTVTSFLFVDSEESGGIATAYNGNNQVIKTAAILDLGDASIQTVVMNAAGTSRLEICYPQSGAVRLTLECPQQMICDGSAGVQAAGGTAPYSFKWSNNATTQSINGLCAGTYTVTVTDAAGCAKQASVNIGDPCISEKRSEEVMVQPADEIGATEIKAYPNPFEHEATLTFTLEKPSKTTAEVFSTDGRRVELLYSGNANANENYRFTLQGENLTKGIYFYCVTTEYGVFTSKLIVVK